MTHGHHLQYKNASSVTECKQNVVQPVLAYLTTVTWYC